MLNHLRQFIKWLSERQGSHGTSRHDGTQCRIHLLVIRLLLLMNRHQLVVTFHLALFWIICQRVSVLRALGPPTELLGWWPHNDAPLQLVVDAW